ncbi:MAG: type 4a pilus biogenesis protein PilO [Patescibacteria group bacterium]|jgi:Tfp pilus assembly protein PilO
MDSSKYLKFNLKNKITASLAGFLIVILSLIYFIVIPTVREIKAMGQSIEAQREDLEKKYIKGQSLKQLTKNLNEIEPKLELLDQIFINKNRELEFITSLEDKAENNQISQKINLSPPQATKSQDFQKIDLQLSTTGKFTKQLKYLIDLESLNYYINMKTLELSSSGGRQTAPNIKNNGQETPAPENEPNNINLFVIADTYWK